MDFVALRYALEQELFIKGAKLLYWEKEQERVLDQFLGPIYYPAKEHKRKKNYAYLGYADTGEYSSARIAYFWKVREEPKTESGWVVNDSLFASRTYQYLERDKREEINPERDILKIIVDPDDSFHSELIENPLAKIAIREMTMKELIASGEYELPPPVMRDLNQLKVTEPYDFEPWSWLDYRAEVLVPLLGIKLLPESDFEFVETFVVDEDVGIVKFGYSQKYYSSRKRIGFSGYY